MLDHPFHPILVHFTVALTITSIAFHLLGGILSNKNIKEQLYVASCWMIWAAALATILTIATGFIQFDSVAHDAGSHLAMVNHRDWAIGTALLLILIATWGFLRYRKENFGGAAYPAAMIILLIILAITAYKGGTLVYHYGLGVKSTPELRELQKQESSSHHDNIFDPEDRNDDGHDHDH